MLRRLAELVAVFLKLGSISFGGPAAHLAMMEHEVVERRNWISRDRFLDLVGATHLIPGPNAVEMASHIGYCRAGLLGCLAGALSFTLPAVAITAVFVWSYDRYGTFPQVEPLLLGIKPAVLAVVFAAVGRLGRKALTRRTLVAISAGVAVAVLAGCDEVVALVVAGIVGVLLLRWQRRARRRNGNTATGILLGATAAGSAQTASAAAVGAAAGTATPAAAPLWKLGLFFLKVGAVMYGGGYVLVAYLEGELVGAPWGLTNQQLLDAVAVGHLTPGPMLTTATFVGYLMGGTSGAVVATLGIILPGLLLVLVVNPLIPRLRTSLWASLFLDAVNAASIGLMAAVTVTLSLSILVDWEAGVPDWRACLIASIAAAAAVRWKVTPLWLVLGGALAGWLLW